MLRNVYRRELATTDGLEDKTPGSKELPCARPEAVTKCLQEALTSSKFRVHTNIKSQNVGWRGQQTGATVLVAPLANLLLLDLIHGLCARPIHL